MFTRSVLALALAASWSFAADTPISEMTSDCPEGASQPVCQVRNGWSLKFDPAINKTPLVYGPDGRFRFPLSPALPGTKDSYAYDVEPDTDGSFVVAATGSGAGGRKSGLLLFDANGLQTAFIDTKDFRCTHIAIASDRSLWVLGYEDAGPKEREHYNILRKYSRTGELLGSFLDRSTFPPGLPPGGPGAYLSIAGDRVAVMAYSGKIGQLRELIELELEGKLLGRMRFDDPAYRSYALTNTGAFYTSDINSRKIILQLDPVAGTTREVKSPGAFPWAMVGADGPNLVYRSVTQGHLKIAWFAPPSD